MDRYEEFLRYDLVTYRREIRKLFDDNSNLMFPNNSSEHATAILIEIFRHATQNVRVFSRNLSKEAWANKELQRELIRAQARGVTIEIAIQESDISENSIKNLLEFLPISVLCNCSPEVDFNFVVADGKMLRFESDVKQYHAVASANSTQLAQVLNEAYELFTGAA